MVKNLQHTVALLQTIPYFSQLKLAALEEIAKHTPLIHLRCGEVLLQQGEAGDSAFILLEGRLKAMRQRPNEPAVLLGEIGKGEIVGEMAALLGDPRNATIVALRHSVLLRLENAQLIDLIQGQKESLLHLIKIVKLRSEKKFAPKSKISSVGLVPLTPGLDLEEFANNLGQAITQYLPTKVLSPAVFASETGRTLEGSDTLNEEELNRLLTGYEDAHPMVLYPTASTWTSWVKCCMGRIDKLILVADAQQSPQLGNFERQLISELAEMNHVSVELVLLHPSRNTSPGQTRPWLENRQVDRHHHMLHGDAAGLQKLARFLTNNVIGVALSGGGFRLGLQAGILHAMQDGGIPIDIVGGSSGGALAGAGFSLLHDPKEFPDLMDALHQRSKGVKKVTFPIVSLFSGKKFTQIFKQLYQDWEIEDLWTQYFCLSLSLVSGDLIVHQTGPVWRSVRASSSVMGLFPPVIHEQDCLVDGGFINPCPVNILTQNGADKVIAISASSKSGIAVDAPFSPEASGWNLLLKRLNPFYKQKVVPTIGSSIMQSMYMASDHLLKQVYAESKIDLFIEPNIDEFASMDREAIKQLYDFGYAYGTERIAEWKGELGL